MELRHIRYFKAVADEKNFTRAAEKLNIAQPPLSRQIQDLEKELDTKLFLRSPHSISLTEEGELFLQYANQILDLVNKSAEEVREVREGLQGMLYIASVEGCAPIFSAGMDLLLPGEIPPCPVQPLERQFRRREHPRGQRPLRGCHDYRPLQ